MEYSSPVLGLTRQFRAANADFGFAREFVLEVHLWLRLTKGGN
jgi:hypothetical protein